MKLLNAFAKLHNLTNDTKFKQEVEQGVQKEFRQLAKEAYTQIKKNAAIADSEISRFLLQIMNTVNKMPPHWQKRITWQELMLNIFESPNQTNQLISSGASRQSDLKSCASQSVLNSQKRIETANRIITTDQIMQVSQQLGIRHELKEICFNKLSSSSDASDYNFSLKKLAGIFLYMNIDLTAVLQKEENNYSGKNREEFLTVIQALRTKLAGQKENLFLDHSVRNKVVECWARLMQLPTDQASNLFILVKNYKIDPVQIPEASSASTPSARA